MAYKRGSPQTIINAIHFTENVQFAVGGSVGGQDLSAARVSADENPFARMPGRAGILYSHSAARFAPAPRHG